MPDRDNEGLQPVAAAGRIAVVRELGASLRRVNGDESYDEDGIRTIWHQGSMRTEMLSWEDQKGAIVRQELAFTGLVVMYSTERGVRTGTVPTDSRETGGGQPMIEMIQEDVRPSTETLDLASHLIKAIPERDFYTQHMLKHVNDAVDSLGYDESRTLISDIHGFSKERRQKRSEPTQKIEIRPPAESRTLAFVLLAVAGVLLGVGVGLLLW